MFSLERQRPSDGLIEVDVIIKGIDRVYLQNRFLMLWVSKIRGHGFKVKGRGFKGNLNGTFFYRVVDIDHCQRRWES